METEPRNVLDQEKAAALELPMPAQPRLARWLPLLVLAAMTLAFFIRFLPPSRIFLMRDMLFIHYPTHIYGAERLRAGELPTWDPYTGCGEPFLANSETAVFYPPNLLFLILPVNVATALLIAMHCLMMAWAAYALARLWRLSRLGALLAAVILTFNSYSIVRVEFFPYYLSHCWTPVIFLAFVMWLRARRTRWLILTAVAVCLQMLAGYPEATAYTMSGLGLYALMISIFELFTDGEKKLRRVLRPLVGCALAALLALLLGMVQFLPTWEAVNLSGNRGAIVSAEAQDASADPKWFLTLLAPSIYGAAGYGRLVAPSMYEYWVGIFYLGLIPILLMLGALAALLIWRARSGEGKNALAGKGEPTFPAAAPWARSVPAFLIASMIIAVLYATGEHTNIYAVIRKIVFPLQKFRWPTKTMVGAVFAWSIFAGMGLDYFLRRGDEQPHGARKWLPLAIIGALFGAAAVFALICLLAPEQVGKPFAWTFFNAKKLAVLQNYGWDNRITLAPLAFDAAKFVVLAALGLGLVAWLLFGRRRDLAAIGLILLAFADLFLLGLRLLPSGSAELLTRKEEKCSPIAGHSKLNRCGVFSAEYQYLYGITDEKPFRLLRDGSAGHWPGADRVFVTESVGNFRVKEHAGLLFLLGKLRRQIGTEEDENTSDKIYERLIWIMEKLLNCDRLVVYSSMVKYMGGAELKATAGPLKAAMPRAYVTGGVKELGDFKETLTAIASYPYNPLECALIKKDDAYSPLIGDLRPGLVNHQIHEIEIKTTEARIKLNSGRAALLVLSDTWYPGWKATVNGAAAPILRVNGAFRAVRVPAGESVVVMNYRPPSVRFGVIISLAAIGALLLAWGARVALWPRKQTQPTSRQPKPSISGKKTGARLAKS